MMQICQYQIIRRFLEMGVPQIIKVIRPGLSIQTSESSMLRHTHTDIYTYAYIYTYIYTYIYNYWMDGCVKSRTEPDGEKPILKIMR